VRPYVQQEIAMALAAPVDFDADGVPDAVDNCQFVPNLDQASVLGNNIGDACIPTPGADLSGGNFDLSGRPCDPVMVTTLAGDGNAGDLNGTGAAAEFRSPFGIAFDRPNGVLYVTEVAGHRIRKIDGAANVSTLAGTGTAGYTDGAFVGQSQFNAPTGLAYDSGYVELLVTDTGNSVTRILNLNAGVAPNNQVLSNCGNGTPGYHEGACMQAQFNGLDSIALDSAGEYVADENNYRIRKILDSTFASSVFVGDGTPGFKDGTGTAAEVMGPLGLAFDVGKLYVADAGNHRVRVVDTAGNITTLAGSGVTGDDDGPVAMATFRAASAITVDAAGDLFVLDAASGLVRRISGGRVDTLAGSGPPGFADGIGCNAIFNAPRGIVAGVGKVLYVADTGNQRIRKITY
jgi:DNA-binding beta-propeller fold protein YncE